MEAEVVAFTIGLLFGVFLGIVCMIIMLRAQHGYISSLENLVKCDNELGKHLYRQTNAFHVTSNALHDWFDVAPLAIKIEIAKIFNKSSAELNLDVDAAESRYEELMAERDAKKVA